MKIFSPGPAILALFLLSSCGKNSTPVAPLPPGLQNEINQNLQNGVIPTPEQVNKGNVPPAPDECATFRSEIPADWFQELLEVPEDPAAPEGRKIHIFYYGKIFPGSVPTVFYNGGPGSDSHGSFSVLSKNKPKYDGQNKISFIYIDQRGNGCSDFYPQMQDNNNPDKETLSRLRLYGSSGIVADSEAVRAKVMRDKKWNVFGQSYGAFIAHRYVVNAPEGVHAAFAHANALQADGFQRIKLRLASQARVFESYLKEYPDDARRFEEMAKYFSIDRCFHSEDGREEICGADILGSFAGLLGFRSSWKNLHDWVSHIYPEDRISDSILGKYLAAFCFGDNSNPLKVAGFAMAVLNFTDRNVAPMNRYNCYRAQQDLLKETKVDLNNVYVNECSGNLQWVAQNKPDFSTEPEPPEIVKMIQSLPRDILTVSKFSEKLLANAELPFYLYSGEKDSVVPVANFQEELAVIKEFPNLHYTHFPATGHDGFYTEAKVWNDIISQSALP